MEKEYVIFAGVNGAGKSTFYRAIKNVPDKRINSDEILRANGGDWKNSIDQADAMKEAVKKINEYLRKGISFNQETTLTGNSIINNINKAKDAGYAVKVYYVGVDSAEIAVKRVEDRVNKGGHGIPEQDIRRRYEQSLQNLNKIIPVCDKVEILDNTKQFIRIAKYKEGKEIFRRNCNWLDKNIERVNNMEEQITEKTKEIHRMYEECKKVFEPSISLFDELSHIEEGDEREFYITLLNFFTQQKQREAIEKGVF